MKLPLNITLVMLSGCASRDPGAGWGDAGHQKFPHTPAQPPFSPSTLAPPHHTHSRCLPPPAAWQIPWLAACSAARLHSPQAPSRDMDSPLVPTPYIIFARPPPPLQSQQSYPCSIASFIAPYLQAGEKVCVLQPLGEKEGEQLLSLACTCAPTLCAHTSPGSRRLREPRVGASGPRAVHGYKMHAPAAHERCSPPRRQHLLPWVLARMFASILLVHGHPHLHTRTHMQHTHVCSHACRQR